MCRRTEEEIDFNNIYSENAILHKYNDWMSTKESEKA